MYDGDYGTSCHPNSPDYRGYDDEYENQGGITMSNEIQKPDSDAKILAGVLMTGDLGKLTQEQQVKYYLTVCNSTGLNPLTKPFEYLELNRGKTVLYATRACTDQLRKLHGISIQIVSRENINDCYIVTARATDTSGRFDESVGAVSLANLKGEAYSNAIMKAETKAKRRVTLSLAGLGMLDESEVDSIPNSKKVPMIQQADTQLIDETITKLQAEKLFEMGEKDVVIDVIKQAGYSASTEIPRAEYVNICKAIQSKGRGIDG